MTNETNPKLIDILLVEDNKADSRLTQEFFKDSKIKNSLFIVEDGVEAINFLRKRGKFIDVPCPDLILLDLNLPQKDGREVLAEIKADDNLKRIPVVIITSSKAEEDILKSYNNHANCFITKPLDLNQFENIVRSIEDFWMTIVKLPKNE
ncbi:MAG: response regulator [Melioribacteraceae bacterium]|nr:response regulator [Melioribacteraceae bacterium]